MLELNFANRAATQTTQAYNSMCRVGNNHYGVTSSGLYRLSGYTDHGVSIPALIKSGRFNLGTDRPKRFRFFYFELECTGDLELSLYCDGGAAAEYAVDGATGVQRIRVPVSRTAQGVWWEWQIENVSGAYLSLYEVKVLPIVL